jgi:RimJ/RimL family protein N-acetyltransferase
MALRSQSVERITAMWHRPSAENTISIVTIGADTFYRAPRALQARVAALVPTMQALEAEFAGEIEQFIGSVRLAYLDEEPAPTAGDVIERIADDDARQRTIKATADEGEWREASADGHADTRYARLENNQLVALATMRIWGETVGSIGVFTDARVRGRGFAGEVATAAIRDAIGRGVVAQWQSRVENHGSARVADKLGFVTLGGRTVVRVRPNAI